MGIGATRLFVHRLDNDDKFLFLSHMPCCLRNGKYYRPDGYYFLCEEFIPDFFPELKTEDEPKEVLFEICDEISGLYMTVEDNYFGRELWIWSEKPEFDAERHRYYKKDTNKDSDISCHFHANGSAFINLPRLESYSGIYNVKLVLKDDDRERNTEENH